MSKVGKRYTQAVGNFKDKSNLTLEDAVVLVKENANAKFDETLFALCHMELEKKSELQFLQEE